MSVAEPDDTEFFRSLEAQMAEVDVGEVLDVTQVPSPQLGVMVKECDKLLADMGELHAPSPKSEAAREVHSRRGALLVEMARRGLR